MVLAKSCLMKDKGVERGRGIICERPRTNNAKILFIQAAMLETSGDMIF